MRFAALLLSSALLAIVGCSSGEVDDAASTDSDLSTGTCRVLREDAEVVVLRGPDGKTMYAGKQLHVVDVRVSPATSGAGMESLGSSRFASGHIQYTIAAKARPEAIRRMGQLLGPGTPEAKVTIDPTGASVETAIRPISTTTSANSDGTANVELNDAPSSASTPLLDAALRKQLVIGAKANATITCGENAIPIAINTQNNIVFDVTQAKVMDPATDLAAIDTFLDTAGAIRGDAYKAPLGEVNDPDLSAKMAAFADIVDREIKPITQAYGGSMSRAEMKTHLQNAYNAYRDLSTTVLAVTKDVNTVDNLQRRNSDGSYSFADNTSAVVTQLLPTANSIRMTVEKSLSDSGDGYVLKPLQ